VCEGENNPVVSVCEGEDNPFKFAAISEEERDGWIQALHMASYECLKMQLQSLREQVQAKTGRDPVTLPDTSNSGLDLDMQTGAKSSFFA
jgi:inositol polyphosphate-4-phosphatase